MKLRTFGLHFSILLLLIFNDRFTFDPAGEQGECTIGVFSGLITADGRPMLWKNRDVTNPVQKFCFFEPDPGSDSALYSFLGNVYSSDTNRVYMGINDVGFAIINSNSYNLNDSVAQGINDGDLLRLALERCRTLADFEDLLDLTAIKGREDCWNIGALDAEGGAALYECSNYSYVKFDANNEMQAPGGMILRATYSLSGGTRRIGFERYKRVTHLVYDRDNETPIDAKFVLQTLARDIANPLGDPYPLPYTGRQNGRPEGYILSRDVTINRTVSRSCMVIRGVRPDEDPRLGTAFCMIGPPVISVAFPLWVYSREVPQMLNTGEEVPMYSQILRHNAELYPNPKDPIYLDSRYLVNHEGTGLFEYTLPLEREILQAADEHVFEWDNQIPTPAQAAAAQNDLAYYIFDSFLSIPILPLGVDDPPVPESPRISNYPNPFNAGTTIQLDGFGADDNISIKIFDLLGRQVRTFDAIGGRDRFISWDGRDGSGNSLPSGLYLINTRSLEFSSNIKTLLLK